MSKRTFIARHKYIVKKLKTKPYTTLQELQAYVEQQLGYLQLTDEDVIAEVSERTLKRDLNEIRSTWGIQVAYDRGKKGYFLSGSEGEQLNFLNMIEAYDVFSSLNLTRELAPFVFREKRKPQGTENLPVLLQAIKKRLKVQFVYCKFWEDTPTERVADPLALKEFKNRWYILAVDNKDNRLKSFGLDRINDLQTTNKKFSPPEDFDVEAVFQHSFGIISPINSSPQEIILSFNPVQGKYIKTLPLHESQQILADTPEELRITLYLYITDDFIFELLSHGRHVKVLAPATLANMVKNAHREAFAQYERQPE
jgi:predicted DNA-binding transcriptional regulator YafY